VEEVKKGKRYTYADYITWSGDFRCELIDGVVYVDGRPYDGEPPAVTAMAPGAAREHQDISSQLHGQLWMFLRGKPCKLYTSPFDVRLFYDAHDDGKTVVQPDIMVVCDKNKISDKGINGAPDFVIEILSPSSLRTDKITKFNQYLNAGVREYWIVDPNDKTVAAHVLINGKYTTTYYGSDSAVPVHVLEGCVIDLEAVFAE
jgi:Uma2 family endonuclease